MPFWDDDRAAVMERGEHDFAGIHEVADMRTPVDEIHARELLAAMDARDKAWDRLQVAQVAGRVTLIDKRQEEYAAAQERVRMLEADGENEAQDWQASEAQRLSLGEALGVGLERVRQQQRVEDFEVFLSYLSQGTVAAPWDMFKNLLALLRRIGPQYLGDLTQTELAQILNETKGAVQAREKRVVEEIQRRWGVLGYRAFGGTKTEETRAKLSAAQKGNRNRKTGAQRKHKAAVAKSKAGGRKQGTGDRKPKKAKGGKSK